MTVNHSITPEWVTKLSAALIALFFASYFNGGYNLTSALLALTAIIVLVYQRKISPSSAPQNLQLLNWTFALFGLNLAIITLSAYLDLDTRSVGRSIEYPAKALLLCIVSYVVIFTRASTASLCYGLVAGGVLGALISGYDVYIQHWRGFGAMMPIQKGNAAILFSTMLFTLSFYWYKSNQKLAWLCLLGANLALAASIMSLSRGGWVLAPLTYLIAAGVFFKQTARHYTAIAILSLIATVTLVFTTAPVGLEERVAVVASEAQSEQGSVGVRIEMWKFAWQLFAEKPLMGWGEDALQPRLDIAVASGELSNYARTFNGNAHSAYFNALSQRGVIGFIGLMAFLAIPGILYLISLVRAKSEETKLWATLGGLHILSTAGFCVSQDHFLHNEGVVLYATTNAILLGFLIRAKNAEKS
ncbi:O-antigen ligase family protein [Vibrio sp. 10N]|uniref:O-antigen ligase family protein n=1 Tax=Vibrio sp. 10N TaxID=3058938 RepID=UPI002812980B|nr:O-antigen ligase [Vibrio sp. 10N]